MRQQFHGLCTMYVRSSSLHAQLQQQQQHMVWDRQRTRNITWRFSDHYHSHSRLSEMSQLVRRAEAWRAVTRERISPEPANVDKHPWQRICHWYHGFAHSGLEPRTFIYTDAILGITNTQSSVQTEIDAILQILLFGCIWSNSSMCHADTFYNYRALYD